MDPTLAAFAKKYLWWCNADEALRDRDRLLRQLMKLGTFDDVGAARKLVTDQAFIDALQNAPAGALDPKSWNYWRLVFRLSQEPPPQRALRQ